MTTAQYVGLASPRKEQPNERLLGAVSFVHQTWSRARRWVRMHRALADLRELDDRMLSDIGLSRSTLYAAAREVHGFGTGGNGPR